jgi:hypothetical protein
MNPDPSAYVTDPADAIVDESGWGLVTSSGVQMTRLPAVDQKTGLYARLSPAGALAAAARLGVRVTSIPEWDAAHQQAFFIPPYTLPTEAMLVADGVNPSDTNAINNYRNARMRSLAWCQLHDAHVRAALANWDGGTIVDNVGKHWCQPDATTSPGFGLIYGWWTAPAPATAKIQTPYRGHLDIYTDYATTVHFSR